MILNPWSAKTLISRKYVCSKTDNHAIRPLLLPWRNVRCQISSHPISSEFENTFIRDQIIRFSRHVSRILFWGLSNAEHMHEAALFNNQNMLFKFSSSLYFYGRADIIPRMCVGLTQWRRWLQCAVRSVGYHHSTSSSVSSTHWNQNTKYVWSSFGAKISSKDLSSVSLAWHRPHS